MNKSSSENEYQLKNSSSENEEQEQEQYEVEKVIGKRLMKGKLMYKIKWKNYPLSQASWEPRSNLNDAQDLIKEFERENKSVANSYHKSDDDHNKKKLKMTSTSKNNNYQAEEDQEQEIVTDKEALKKNKFTHKKLLDSESSSVSINSQNQEQEQQEQKKQIDLDILTQNSKNNVQSDNMTTSQLLEKQILEDLKSEKEKNMKSTATQNKKNSYFNDANMEIENEEKKEKIAQTQKQDQDENDDQKSNPNVTDTSFATQVKQQGQPNNLQTLRDRLRNLQQAKISSNSINNFQQQQQSQNAYNQYNKNTSLNFSQSLSQSSILNDSKNPISMQMTSKSITNNIQNSSSQMERKKEDREELESEQKQKEQEDLQAQQQSNKQSNSNENSSQQVQEQQSMQQLEDGSLKQGDKPKKIVGAKQVSNDCLVFFVEWEPRSDQTIPRVSKCTNIELKDACPRFLCEYYESKLKPGSQENKNNNSSINNQQ